MRSISFVESRRHSSVDHSGMWSQSKPATTVQGSAGRDRGVYYISDEYALPGGAVVTGGRALVSIGNDTVVIRQIAAGVNVTEYADLYQLLIHVVFLFQLSKGCCCLWFTKLPTLFLYKQQEATFAEP